MGSTMRNRRNMIPVQRITVAATILPTGHFVCGAGQRHNSTSGTDQAGGREKTKPGDQVTAQLTEDVKSNGHVLLHKGSKLMGHVTEAQARGKGQSESKLGIVFDNAQLKDGEEDSLNAVIQALAPPVQAAAFADAGETGTLSATTGGSGAVAGGSGLVGGVTR
jgi:hypothetical protein